MIQANIVTVDSSFDIASGGMRHYLVLQLPNGAFVRAEVDERTTTEVLQYVADGGEVQQPAEDLTIAAHGPVEVDISGPPTQYEEPEPEQVAPAQQLVMWSQLDDNVVSPAYKAALTALGAPDTMSAEELVKLVHRIQNEFTASDWTAAGVDPGSVMSPSPQSAPQPAPPAPPAPQQPPLGQIQWADGGPILPGMSRVARTVPKDDMGYPIVSTTDRDPGEIVGGGDTDEDGVGQV